MTLLEVRNLKKIYGRGKAKISALNGVSLKVENGEFVAIMGPSGSGKTTLLNLIGGLDTPSEGEILIDGIKIGDKTEEELVKIRREKIAYVFQQYHLIPSLTAVENVMLPILFSNSKVNGSRINTVERAVELLRMVGLEKRAKHKPFQLSGGEQQRVAIARALANNPLLLLVDEPTGNLDEKTGNEILNLFKKLKEQGRAIFMVTHNPESAKSASRLIQIKDGSVISDQIQEVGV